MALSLLQTAMTVLVGACVMCWFARKRLPSRGKTRLGGDPTRRGTLRDEDVNNVRGDASGGRPESIEKYRRLFFELHNLESHFETLPQARHELFSLLSKALYTANKSCRSESKTRTIMSVKNYSFSALQNFIMDSHKHELNRWQTYVAQRAAGQSAPLFASRASAEAWLRSNAPLRFVDGGWLGHVHRLTETSPFALRGVTKDAWQILSEELGDGDVNKNHVYVYRNLLRSAGIDLPPAWDAEFVRRGHGMDDVSVWRAAACQMLLGLFPDLVLPEVLGFNLHFEQVTLETLKASMELPAHGLSAEYFLLHVCIDNADSGHAAMALNIVARYIDLVQATEGPAAAKVAWDRVKAGFALSESVSAGATPLAQDTCNASLSHLEASVIDMIGRKAQVAQHLHCTSRVRIGRKRLADWLSPELWLSPLLQADLLRELADAAPWVKRGNSKGSRLVSELSWGGKMFGACTDIELQCLEAWINSLTRELPERGDSSFADTPNDPEGLYWSMVDGAHTTPKINQLHSECPRVYAQAAPVLSPLYGKDDFRQREAFQLPQSGQVNMFVFLPLWFAHPCLLQSMVTVPYRTTTMLTGHIIRILRAEAGFPPETGSVQGVEEQNRNQNESSRCLSLINLGLEIRRRHPPPFSSPASPPACSQDVGSMFDQEPSCLGDVLARSANTRATKFARDMLQWSTAPVVNGPMLLGLARAFLDLEAWVASGSGSCGILSQHGKEALRSIVTRKTHCLNLCFDELRDGQAEWCGEFVAGYELGRDEIEMAFLR